MKNFWKAVNDVMRRSDVLLMILDARFIEQTRNPEIEQKVRRLGKPLIYVITKSDLVGDKKALESWKKRLRPSVFVSVRKHQGSLKLRDRILIEADRCCGKQYEIWVGVLGYPNVGKSSIINLMKGRHSASTSKLSGHTKSVQMIKADKRIMFLDTPGVIPYMEDDRIKHISIGAIDFSKARDPDLAASEFMRRFPGKIEAYYGVKASPEEDKQDTLEAIAMKKNVLKKGGLPDVIRASRMILHDFQTGKIR